MPSYACPLLVQRANAIAPSTGVFPNVALEHATDIMKSEAARLDGQLLDDFNAILKGNCIYCHDFICHRKDLSMFETLKSELAAHTAATQKEDSTGGSTGDTATTSSSGMVDWSKHMKYENPVGVSTVFQAIVDMLCEYFDTEMFACRLNYYGNGEHWKPFHHDSHAYGSKGQREDITIGVSLGATRALAFLHEPSKRQFSFPQLNGDVFAFTSDVNSKFMHGVPRGSGGCGDRFSVIVWGRRRSVNERNGGGSAALHQRVPNTVTTMDDAIQCAHQMVSVERRGTAVPVAAESSVGSQPATAGGAKPKKKNRLQ